MSFGKRPSTLVTAPVVEGTVQQAPQPDPHARRKVLPDEAWNGPNGAMLRVLGIGPDDERNLVPNASSLNAAVERSRAAHETAYAEAVQRVRSTMPSAEIRPFFLIPDAVWNGPGGVFLMTTLELYPFDAWNVVYLAADERTALVLDLAPHPGKDVPAFVRASQEFVATAITHMDKVRMQVERTQKLAAFAEAQDDLRDRVRGMAVLFARRMAEAWAENSPNRGGRAH
ncbi:MAG: hypothetical protein R3C30_14480 [Hyphomonadaceae bacterium]